LKAVYSTLKWNEVLILTLMRSYCNK